MKGLELRPAYCQKGGVQFTSSVFVSVPLGPILRRGSNKLLLSFPRAQQNACRWSQRPRKTHQRWLLGEQLSKRLGYCCHSCMSKAAVNWAVTTLC